MPSCCVTPGQHRSCDGVCPPTPEVCESQKRTLSSGIEGEDCWDLRAPHGSDFYSRSSFWGMERDCFLPPGSVSVSLNALLLQLRMAILILSQKLSQWSLSKGWFHARLFLQTCSNFQQREDMDSVGKWEQKARASILWMLRGDATYLEQGWGEH